MVAKVRKILQEYRVIAVVGLSGNPERDSYRVASYLKSKGYRIIPVNPNYQTILDEKCYPSLDEVPEDVEVVQIFRKPEAVPEIVNQALEKGVKAIWMQKGIVHEESAGRAERAGLDVVMDRCMMVEHMRLTESMK